ncbi:DUF6344 domain-containing protein [Streptomyces mangrovisoli]|uniref:DUF6344 domain-containing protein n=1 Tax=Streptomyces mangrovisoli TaxID=1428628 RepID=UPI000ABEE225|nr:DUF6344 domain-containing protein [Streptomyces mangrovisoli]
MAQNKVMKLWTTVVTAFLALFSALGLITTTAGTAVAQTGTVRNSSAASIVPETATPHWPRCHPRSLPPTMKQRIHAEAHGSSPSCRHHSLDGDRLNRFPGLADTLDEIFAPAELAGRLQR